MPQRFQLAVSRGEFNTQTFITTIQTLKKLKIFLDTSTYIQQVADVVSTALKHEENITLDQTFFMSVIDSLRFFANEPALSQLTKTDKNALYHALFHAYHKHFQFSAGATLTISTQPLSSLKAAHSAWIAAQDEKSKDITVYTTAITTLTHFFQQKAAASANTLTDYSNYIEDLYKTVNNVFKGHVPPTREFYITLIQALEFLCCAEHLKNIDAKHHEMLSGLIMGAYKRYFLLLQQATPSDANSYNSKKSHFFQHWQAARAAAAATEDPQLAKWTTVEFKMGDVHIPYSNTTENRLFITTKTVKAGDKLRYAFQPKDPSIKWEEKKTISILRN